MGTKVAQMTKDELQEMIETTVEQKLGELLGDPDEGLPLRKPIRDRLLRQKKAVEAVSVANLLKMWCDDSVWSNLHGSRPHFQSRLSRSEQKRKTIL